MSQANQLIESYLRQEYSVKGYMASAKPLFRDVQMLLANLWQLERKIISKYGPHWKAGAA